MKRDKQENSVSSSKYNTYVKYPRTYHVPWTESATQDDKINLDLSFFDGKEVVVTEKRDGESASVYWDGYSHARSLDGHSHPSQNWLKNNIQSWFFNIPEGWRVCGENLYATHAIKYDNLESYFEVFSIWNEKNECLSWKETQEWSALLGLKTVPVLFKGMYDEDTVRGLKLDCNRQEGYVIRLVDSFNYSDFRFSCAKFVRGKHVQESAHNWRMEWKPNMKNTIKKGE
jgi:hypothetical protein